MNSEREFNNSLKKIKSEILYLKTAHQRPLGALDFFEDSVSFDVTLSEYYGIYSANITVTVTIDIPAVTSPIVQTGWEVPNGFYSVFYYGASVSEDYSTWTYDLTLTSTSATSASMKVGAISSQPIESITWSVS